MNSKNIVHRDLKPSNILLVEKNADLSRIKLADFGYARIVADNEVAETACGTPLYMVTPSSLVLFCLFFFSYFPFPFLTKNSYLMQAPEVFKSKSYDAKADLWSVGCILYEMVFGRVPFSAKNVYLLFQAIERDNVSFPKEPPISDSLKVLHCSFSRDYGEPCSTHASPFFFLSCRVF